MHLWPSDYRDAQEQRDKIHDHLFNARSRVVFGGIADIRYRFIPGMHGNYREVRVDYRQKNSSLRETGFYGDVEIISTNAMQAPSEYVIPAFDLHESVLITDLALTVVHTTDPVSYEPRAIFRRNSELPPVRTPVICDKSLWRSFLQQMLPL